MKTDFIRFIGRLVFLVSVMPVSADSRAPIDSSPLHDKAAFFQRDLLDKHWLDGLYVSIVPSAPSGTRLAHTVNQPGNVIHSGVWTGRYLGGVGYQYAVTRDSWVRRHGGEILHALRTQQEVTGKPGLLARGYIKGHGPVEDWERRGQDSPKWHQGQGRFSDFRWHGDVSAADAPQGRKFYSYANRRLDVLVDAQGKVISLGLYQPRESRRPVKSW